MFSHKSLLRVLLVGFPELGISNLIVLLLLIQGIKVFHKPSHKRCIQLPLKENNSRHLSITVAVALQINTWYLQ